MRTITSHSWDYAVEHGLREEQKKLREAVSDGAAVDWGEYKRLCGEIRGIQVAIDVLIRIREQLNRDEDQDLK